MKTIILIYLLVFAQLSHAQKAEADIELEKIDWSLGKVISKYEPKFSTIGNIYLIVCVLKNNRLADGVLLSKNGNTFDTTDLKKEDKQTLEIDLVKFAKQPDCTIIAPFVFVEDPKKTPNGQILYRSFIIDDLGKALYKITRNADKSIVLPMSKGEKNNIRTN
ncbi:hypothetical protein GCM10027051_13140 [Niabella terrae]